MLQCFFFYCATIAYTSCMWAVNLESKEPRPELQQSSSPQMRQVMKYFSPAGDEALYATLLVAMWCRAAIRNWVQSWLAMWGR